MKKTFYGLLIVCILAIASCKPDSIKDFTTNSAYNIANLQGVWKLSKAVQTDEDAKRKNFPNKTNDITNLFNLTDITVTLAASGALTVDYGAAPALFNTTTGNWKLDNPAKPGNLWFINGTDTTKFVLGSYDNLRNKKLVLKQTKYYGKVPMVGYDYEFSKN